jgi:pimeloyl-ACP methyl ester carboxylesterase
MPISESDNVLQPINGTDYSRPLIIFLPGLSGNLGQWDSVLPKLNDLAADLAYGPPILPHPAYGNSRPTVLGVASAIAAELRRDGRRDVLIVAHSVGTFVALSVARLAPDLVRSVVVVNGGLVQVAKFLDRPARMMIASPRTCISSLRLFVLVAMPAPDSVKRAIANSERSSRLLFGGLVSDAALESAEQRNSLIEEAGSPAAVRALWDNRHHWREFESYAHQIPAKVLFLAGDQDPMSSEADSRAMAAMLPNAEVRVLKGAGHAAPLETAGAVADAITENYLAGHKPAAVSMLR